VFLHEAGAVIADAEALLAFLALEFLNGREDVQGDVAGMARMSALASSEKMRAFQAAGSLIFASKDPLPRI
jgi:hypothetical protein